MLHKFVKNQLANSSISSKEHLGWQLVKNQTRQMPIWSKIGTRQVPDAMAEDVAAKA